VEVIRHPLNPLIQTRNLAQHSRQILQNQPPTRIRVFRLEFRQIVADRTPNIHEENCIAVGLGSFDQALAHGEEALVHPAQSALAVAAHVVVELRAHGRVGLQVGEHVEVRVVGVLVGAVGGGVGFAVGGRGGVGVEV